MDEPPKSFMDKYRPAVEGKIKTENPTMPEPDRKKKASDYLAASWPRLSEKKRAEFMPKEAPAKEETGESFDLKFEGLFGDGKSIIPDFDLDDALDSLMDAL